MANSHSPAAEATQTRSWGCIPSSASPGHGQHQGEEPQTGARAICVFRHNLRDDEHVQSYTKDCLGTQKCPRGSPARSLDAFWGAKSLAAACCPTLPAWPPPARAPCLSLSSLGHPCHPPSDQLQPLPVPHQRHGFPVKEKAQTAGAEWQQKALMGCRCSGVPCATPSPPVPSCPTGREPGLLLPPRASPLARHRALYVPSRTLKPLLP